MHHDDDDDAAHDLRRWLGDDGARAPAGHDDVDAPPRRWTPPRVALAVLVLAPWVVLVALALIGTRSPATTAASADGGGPTGLATAQPADAPTDRATPTSPVPAARATPTDDAAVGDDDLAAGTAPAAVGPTAVRMVRDAVTRTGARSMALDAAAAEAADPLASDTWAVRVHAVVLRGDRRRWHSATHEVWAAPVGLRAGRVVGLDPPWRVATVDGGIAATSWDRADVDLRTVRGALDDAGIDHGDDLVVERHPDVPSVVRVTIAGTDRVWVRMRPQPTVVGRVERAR